MAEKLYPPVSKAINAIVPTVEKVIDAYQYAETAEEKNRLLKSIIQKVDYEKFHRATGKESAAKGMKLVIYPKL